MFSTTRFRSQDLRQTKEANIVSYNSSGAVSATYPYGDGLTGTYSDIADNPHPRFRELQKNGAVVMGDFSRTKWSRTAPDCNFQYGPYPYWNGAWNCFEGDWMAVVESLGWAKVRPIPVGDVEQMRQIALVKAYAKLNAAKVLSGEPLSDVGKSVAMLRRPFGSAQKLLKKMIKKRDRRVGRQLASYARATADTWLEYRYGWQPIFIDASSIIDDVTRKLSKANDRQERLVVRAGMSQINNPTGSFQDVTLPDNVIRVSGTARLEQEVRVGAGVVYDLAARTSAEAFTAYYGLRARDIPVLLWEKVPFSFVADWFVNVGDWLEASLPNPDISVRGDWVTTVEKTKFTCSAQGSFSAMTSSTQRTTFTPDFGESITDSVVITRDCNRSVPNSPLATVGNLSLIHLTDAASLSVGPILGLLNRMRH